MNVPVDDILARLTRSQFDYPVAIYAGQDPDLGPTIEVVAFDVPEAEVLDVSRQLNRMLPLVHDPVMLGSAYIDYESTDRRLELPIDAHWYQPRSAPEWDARPASFWRMVNGPDPQTRAERNEWQRHSCIQDDCLHDVRVESFVTDAFPRGSDTDVIRAGSVTLSRLTALPSVDIRFPSVAANSHVAWCA